MTTIRHDHSGMGAARAGFGAACGCFAAVFVMGFLFVGGCGVLFHVTREPLPPLPTQPTYKESPKWTTNR